MSNALVNHGIQPASTTILYKIFQLVKHKLSCLQHPGENQWCWVDPHTLNAEHLPLCLHDIQSWACYLYNHPDDTTCTTLPDTAHFIQFRKTREPRGTSLIRTPTELISPVTHAYDFEDSKPRIPTEPPQNDTISRQTALYLAPEGDSFSIKKVLRTLHVRYPALNYPQYEDRLLKQGVLYLVIASMFDADFYVAKVGMVPGAAHFFCHWVAEELRRSRQGNGGMENYDDLDKENFDPNQT